MKSRNAAPEATSRLRDSIGKRDFSSVPNSYVTVGLTLKFVAWLAGWNGTILALIFDEQGRAPILGERCQKYQHKGRKNTAGSTIQATT